MSMSTKPPRPTKPRIRMDTIASHEALNIDPDKVLESFGTFGKYQLFNIFMVSATSSIYSALMMVMPFLSEESTGSQCKISEEYAKQYKAIDKCNVMDIATGKSLTCLSLLDKGTYFDHGNCTDAYTLTSTFNLVCEDNDWREHGSSAFLFGSMIGSVALAYLSDKLGRRKSFLFSLFLSFICNLLTAAAPWYSIFLVLRVVAGVGLGGNLNIAYAMSPEVVAPEMREYLPFVNTLFWVLGYMWAGVARMLTDNWRIAYLLCTAPGLLAIPYIWWFPESLHWMVSRQKAKGIKSYIRAATRYNNTTINIHECKSSHALSEMNPENPDNDSVSSDRQSPFKLIFTNGKVVYLFLISSFMMICMNATYWYLSLFSTELSENKMTGFFLSGLIEIPACFFAVFLLKLMKRRPVSVLMFVLTALCLLLTVILPVYLSSSAASIVVMGGPLLAKMFNSIVWSVLPLAMSEMTPTVIRNSFSGGVCFLGDLGSVVAPYLENLSKYGKHLDSSLIIVMTGISALCVLTMPETKGIHLGSDMEHFNEGPFLRRICKKSRAGKTASKLSDVPEERLMEEAEEDTEKQVEDTPRPSFKV